MIAIVFSIPDAHGPAFRSAVDDFSTFLAKKVEMPASYAKEQTLTEALSAVGVLRAATNSVIATEDPHYDE